MLIEIKPGLIINTSDIKRAYKRGTYTDIRLFDQKYYDLDITVDDEHDVIWNLLKHGN